jgi:hypothetical protein
MDKKVTEEKFRIIIKNSKSKSDVCRELNLHINGSGFRNVDLLINEYNVDISHFDKGYSKRKIKHPVIEKECPVCKSNFKTKKGHVKEKETCSYSCSNTYFRSGINNPNWKTEAYRSTCFLYHEKKCVTCGEEKIIDVHHFDEDRGNNSPENLIPLCPTHHMYWHSRYKDEVYDKVVEYRKKFINNRDVD